MIRPLRAAAVGLLLPLFTPSIAEPQTYEVVGTRAAGMGGAFVAVADDASAIYWNPAAMATGAFFSLALDRNSVAATPDTGLQAGSQSATFVALGVPALGLTYYRLRATNVASLDGRSSLVTSLITHHAGVTLVQSLTDNISVGTTLKLVRGIAAAGFVGPAPDGDLLDQAEDLVGSARNQFDADLGVFARVGTLRAGLAVRNVREPEFKLPSNEATLQLARQVRGGVALTIATGVLVSADFDFVKVPGTIGLVRNFAAGGEAQLTRRGLVRGGFRFNTVEDQSGGRAPVGTAGGSYAALSSVFIDGHVTFGGDHSDRGWGVAARVIF
jgi:hypothetical protein